MGLPNGWVVALWSEIVMITHGQPQKGIEDPNGMYPIYGSGGQIGKASRFLCKAGSTVVGRKGTINNPFFTKNDFWNIDTAFGISPHDGVLPEFLYLFCKHFNFKTLDHSTGRPSLTQTSLYGIKMPLPPLAEQHRIVAKIDALFSELDKGVEMLETIRQQLMMYRQAVLGWAFEEVITEEIQRKRVVELCSQIVDCQHSTPKWTEGGKLCLRTTNFREGYLDLSEKNYVSNETYNERIRRLKPEENDVLYSREGAILGIACLVPRDFELCLGQRMMLMRPSDLILPQFLMYYLNSPHIEAIVKKMTGGTASPHINIRDIKQFSIPLPNLSKQAEIVTYIESCMSIYDKLEQILSGSMSKAQALKQSILKKAFAGELVPQDPSDEPAERLLERIKAEQKKETAKPKPARRKKNA